MDVTVGTFNLNNLFDRFDFDIDLGSVPAAQRQVDTTYRWELVRRSRGPGDPAPQLDELASSTPVVRVQRSIAGPLVAAKPEQALRAIAERIGRIAVDVLAVQEVENIDALRRFNRQVLADPYPYEVLIEGNDPRFIDVGVLSRLPLANLTSHRLEVHPDEPDPIFSRDLLQVDVLDPRRRRRLLVLFVNHLKSKFVPFAEPDPHAAQVRNDLRRRRQAQTVERVVEARTRPDSRFVVLGDFNDAPDAATLEPMIAGLDLVDALRDVTESREPPATRNPEDAPATVRWTHRLSRSGRPDLYELLDQVWLSRALEDQLVQAQIERRPRWSASSAGVGSDHDPVWVRLTGV